MKLSISVVLLALTGTAKRAAPTEFRDFPAKEARVVPSHELGRNGLLSFLATQGKRMAVFGLSLVVSLAGGVASRAIADNYPQRAVTLVVPFAPGGGTDILARMLAQELQERLKQPFVVENRPGAGSLIAAAAVAKSPPDGHMLFLAPATTLVINPAVYKSLPYDPINDFQPVGLTGAALFVLIVSPSLGVNTLSELIALVKSKPPGEMSYASAGSGTPHHVFMEMFLKMAGLQMQHIPYRGSMPALTDVLVGTIPVMIVDVTPSLPLIQEGRVKALAVTQPTRVKVLPDVPTIAEAGLPGYSAMGWFSVVARAGTPRSAIDKLSQVLMAYLAQGGVQDKLEALGMDPSTSTPDQLKHRIASEIQKWTKVVKEAGISRVE